MWLYTDFGVQYSPNQLRAQDGIPFLTASSDPDTFLFAPEAREPAYQVASA